MDANESFQKLIDVVSSGEKFQNHATRVKTAKWNYSMLEGESQDEYILRYRTKETKAQKEQRLNVYNSRTPYVSKKAMAVYDYVEQSDNKFEAIEFKETETESSKNFKESVKNINGVGLLKYCYGAFKRLNFYDPNAFLFINEKDGNFVIDEIYSEAVIDYNYKNSKLEYFIFEEGANHWIISNSVYGRLRKLKEKQLPVEGEIYVNIAADSANSGRYAYSVTVIDKKECPAYQVGYIKDPKTKWKTFISPIQVAEKLFDDLMRDKNAYDVAKSVHAFLKKYAYVPECNNVKKFEHNILSCKNGYYENGDECQACKGTGMKVHFSEQDVILLKMKTLDDAKNLSNLVHYERIPVDMVQAYKEDFGKWEQDILKMMFNSDTFTKGEVKETATGKILDIQAVHSKFIEYANCLASGYRSLMSSLSEMYFLEDHIDHKFLFNNDFRIESLEDLILLREKTESPFVIEIVESKILHKVSNGDIDLVNRVEAREKFRPFKYRTDSDKALILSSLLPTDKMYILFMYYDEVFDIIEQKVPMFHKLKNDEQRMILDKNLELFINGLKAPEQVD